MGATNRNIQPGQRKTGNNLSAFGGVFTPSILTILGVILFMRSGFVIGQAGIFQTILILCLSHTITLLTAISVSAVSTNTPVSAGGAYFLISRSIGPELGGAIGLALFCSQAISVPFYILGFTESLVRTFPDLTVHFRTIALITTAFLFIITRAGARWAVRAQYLIMTVLGLSILAFMGGALIHFDINLFSKNLGPGYTNDTYAFWSVFVIYFPAVTGIMAGISMSGDLKNPARAIPAGTLGAVFTGFVVYGLQIIVCGGAQSREELIYSSFETLCRQALFNAGFLVVAGVFAATLSSALGSFMGAPRVIQAVAKDRLIPMLHIFKKGTGQGNEPVRALWLTLGLTITTILWAGNGDTGRAFNILAGVVTMFFLYTYAMINVAAFVESFAGNPSFRPGFKHYHWLQALIAAAGCAVTAFLIQPVTAVCAAGIISTMVVLLRRRSLTVRFGDARWGFFYSRLKANLHQLAMMPIHPKNWRPAILVFTGNPKTRFTLVQYALWIGEERGSVTLVRILTGNVQDLMEKRQTALTQLKKNFHDYGVSGFSMVMVLPDLDQGICAVLQAHPPGPLKPNTVIFGWSSDPDRAQSFTRHLRIVRAMEMNLVIINDKGLPQNPGKGFIDIWWRGKKNGSLMVMLAHLLTQNRQWADATIRLFRIIQDTAGVQPAKQALETLLRAARVKAESRVIVSTDIFEKVLQSISTEASVVFIGFNVPEPNEAAEFQTRHTRAFDPLPTMIMVSSIGDCDLFA
ncbi:amino acid permease [uncultured Desulfobacter sp.]|uniref:amino acid permease n=1 Tax=uncultured Desulfobacter sp. TaxID=240139 RepID=UPI0029F4E96D|nr:amino acid permease [uncultured Desulfobacter sp.]